MKFKRIISIALLFCMIFMLASCKSGASQAKKLTTNIMSALTTYDINAISKCVEDLPDSTGTSTTVDIYTSDYFMDIYAAANANLSYTVVNSSSKEIILKVQMPDLASVHKNAVSTVLAAAQNNTTLKDQILNGSSTVDPNLIVPAYMLNEIKTNGLSTVEKEIKLSVVKINGDFKIKNDDQLKLLLSDGLSEINVFSAIEASEE